MADFHSGKMTPEVARQRMLQTTAEQMAGLTNDPAFHAWQAAKAQRENRARVVTNALAVAACVALAVTMALLKPAANVQALPPPQVPSPPAAEGSFAAAVGEAQGLDVLLEAGLDPWLPEELQIALQAAQARLGAAQAEAHAARDAAASLSQRLQAAEDARQAAAARLQVLEASSAAQEAETEASEAAAAELLAHMTVQLADLRAELAKAEATAVTAASLAEASAAAAIALLEAQPAGAAEPPACSANAGKTRPTAEELFGPNPEAALAELEAAQLLPGQVPAFFFNATMAARPAPSAFFPPRPTAIQPQALISAAAAFSVALLVAAALHLRGRRRLTAEAARAAALAARLKEAAFAKDTAEQSLGMVERELQHRMKQLGEAQQAAADAASPRIGTAPSPPLPGLGSLRTPPRGELPPPPASLVEKFLRDHNFLAVQQEQMTEWLEMEQQFGEMQAALDDMQAALAEKDEQIEAHQQDIHSANENTSVELRHREDQLAQVRSWLDEAQEELLETQAALQEREAECRRVTSQLEAMHAVAAQGPEDREGALVRQNLELVAQLQSATTAYEALRGELAGAARGGAAVRPVSAASTVPGTPTDFNKEVQSCLEMMRATREQLADRLAHSQGVCEAMIADCQDQASRRGSVSGEAQTEAEAEASTPAPAPAPFGSPTAVTPNPLFEAEGWEGEDELAAVLAPAGEAQAAEEQCVPAGVLGASSRHNASRQGSPAGGKSPAAGECATPDAGPGSMRDVWHAAHARVAEAREACNSWDLAGFVRQLGFEVEGEHAAAPMDRTQFEVLRGCAEEALAAAASNAASSPERALAGEAMQVVHEWEFPAQRINTPPPSPFWRMLGMSS